MEGTYLTERKTREDNTMVKRILFGVLGTEFTPVAFRYAMQIAKAHEAEITALPLVPAAAIGERGAVPLGATSFARRSRAELRAQREECRNRIFGALEDLRRSCEEARLPCAIRDVAEEPFEALKGAWRYHDLTVFGVKGFLNHALLEEPTKSMLEFIRQGVRPILGVSKTWRPIKKVAIAYDGSMESSKSMKRYMQMRLWPEADVEVVHFEGNREHVAGLLADAMDYGKAYGRNVTAKHIQSPARTSILPYVSAADVDLLVIGNSARKLLTRRLFGDTVSHVVTNAEIPVFLSS
jgi:nucleotide-binding universal stress UspA family protein